MRRQIEQAQVAWLGVDVVVEAGLVQVDGTASGISVPAIRSADSSRAIDSLMRPS